MKFSRITRVVAAFTSSAWATITALFIVLVWLSFGPRNHWSNHWQLPISTISSAVTFLMVFVLNNAQKRDTATLNVKLDALLLASEATDNKIIALEYGDDEALVQMRHAIADQAKA